MDAKLAIHLEGGLMPITVTFDIDDATVLDGNDRMNRPAF